MNKKYSSEQLNGMKCSHGSPGYGTPEVIEDIVPYKGKPLNGIINRELWEVQFQSGKFTIIPDEALQLILKEGECFYHRAAGFSAMEVIQVCDEADRSKTCSTYCEDWFLSQVFQ